MVGAWVVRAAERAAYARRLDEAVRTAVEKLAALGGVRRVSLFGSYVRGRRDLFTDLDILVVMESDRPFVERVAWLHGYLGLGVDLDILCYTPEEFRALRETPFLRRVLAEERLLFERAG